MYDSSKFVKVRIISGVSLDVDLEKRIIKKNDASNGGCFFFGFHKTPKPPKV
jgi:hypothetical protein